MRSLFLTVVVLLTAAQAHAFENKLTGTRALALQGGTASPYDNASIFVNPAGVTLNPRYDVTGMGWYEQETEQQLMHLSIVDGMTSAELGAGFGWNRFTGNQLPHDDLALALSQEYASGAFGIAGHYRIDRERFDQSGGKVRKTDLNLDVGVLFDPADQMFKLALVGYDLFNPPEGVTNVHREFAAGLASRWVDIFEITADVVYAPDAAAGSKVSWAVGAEVMPLEYFAVRGGYGQFPGGPNRVGHWTAGLGGGIPDEFRAGYTYRHPIGTGEAGTHAAEIAFYFFP